jgi:glycosyltransferase involved in cell wall biosynthesis
MPSRRAPGRLRVALDGEPLLGARTGVGMFTYWLLDALAGLVRAGRADLDLGVFAITFRMRSDLAARLPAGCRLFGVPTPARPVTRMWERGLRAPLELFTGRLDVVHGTNYKVPPTWRAGRVVSVHDLTPLHFPEMCEPETLAYPDLIRRAARDGTWIQTPCRFITEEVISAFGADPERVRTVYYGVPPLPAAGPAPRPAAGPFDRYILAIGTVEPRKDYPSLIDAFDQLAPSRPDVGLVIVGRDGWGSEPFRRAVEASPHRSRIARMGYLDDADLHRVLNGASVLAYPSRYEGFGFPPLQAMATGIPVVATQAGSLPEVVGDAAELVPVGDATALAAALSRVLDDPSSAAARVEAGRRRAAGFTWESCALQMLEIYRSAAAG